MPATSAATRSMGKAKRVSRVMPVARRGPAARRRGGPPLSAAGSWPRCRRLLLRQVIGEPGIPAEAEGAVDQGLVAADRDIGADLEVGPAQLVFDLFVALLDPVPDAVDPHDLGQAR